MGLFIAALALWLSVGCGAEETPPAASSPSGLPRVVSASPAGGVAHVPVTTTVTATFSDEMDRSTITTATFTMRSAADVVTGSVTTTATTATFTPSSPLKGGDQSVDQCADYVPRLDASIRDAKGRALTFDTVWTFTTCPVAVRVSPATATVPKGVAKVFEGIVTGKGTFAKTVLWSVDGGEVNGRIAMLDAFHGVYTPPATIPSPHTVTVRAFSLADLTSSGTAQAAVVTGALLSFAPNVRVTTLGSLVSTWSSGRHSIAVVGTTVYAAWADLRSGGSNWDVYVGRSQDPYQTWSSQRVNDDGSAAVQIGPSLALDSLGSVVVAWEDQRNGNADIYLARSTDGGGQSFSANVMVNDSLGSLSTQRAPSLALNSLGSAFVAWEDYRYGLTSSTIYFAKSENAGQSFALVSQINPGDLRSSHESPSLALDSRGPVYTAWTNRGSGTPVISFARTENAGLLFSITPSTVNAGSNAREPSIAVDGDGTIYAAWEDLRAGTADIFFSRSTDAGVGFRLSDTVPDFQLNDVALGSQLGPSLAIGPPGHIYVAWTDLRSGHADIYVAKSLNGGLSFGPGALVNNGLTSLDQTDQRDPSLAVDAVGRAYVIWTDRRNCGSTTLCGDIYFARGE